MFFKECIQIDVINGELGTLSKDFYLQKNISFLIHFF